MASPSIGSNTSPTSSTEDGDAMPHVIVKLWRGKSEQQKRRLAQAITDDVMKVLHYGDESVSVAFEEVDANRRCTSLTSYARRHPVQEAGLHDVERPCVAKMNERQV
jgi:phenylpyruvate tautomerase PptA (4-oxalocrotonate tautomerase family)